jgi:MotA/TolQ/ExbB proton channel family
MPIVTSSSDRHHAARGLRHGIITRIWPTNVRTEPAGPGETAQFDIQAEPATRASGNRAPQIAFVSRCVVLQAIGAALVAGLWIAGLANKPFEGATAALCWIILGIGALGVACVFMRRWRDVEWLATHVVRIGLLGTVVGLIIAFSAAAQGGSSNPEEIKPMISAVVNGMYVSLYATLLGITVNLWLKLNLRLLGNVHG